MPDEVIAGPVEYSGGARARPLFSFRHMFCSRLISVGWVERKRNPSAISHEVSRWVSPRSTHPTRCRHVFCSPMTWRTPRASMLLVVEQFLNGLQFGLLLFLLAAGLTLVFGIMDFVNLAHGSLYMMGAYFAATFVAWTGNFIFGVLLALGATLLLGIVAGIRGAAASLRPRSSRPRAGDLRADPVLQRRGAADLGPGGAGAAAAGLADGAGPDPARHLLSRLSAGDHRGRACGGADALYRGDANPDRHADPRRRLEPGNDRRARHQHQAALYPGVRARRGARRPCRDDAGADPDRADRDGREHPDPGLRHHRDRRHRLDPRRVPGRDLRRHDRHARPRLPARSAAARS